MNLQDDPSQSKVTLDQLLSLKKHEKPAPQFWESFDKQLHARSLQALSLRKKRFSLPNIWAALTRALLSPAVPMAAAASLVFTLVTPSFINVTDNTFASSHTSEQCSQIYFVHNCMNANQSPFEQFATASLDTSSSSNFFAHNIIPGQEDTFL